MKRKAEGEVDAWGESGCRTKRNKYLLCKNVRARS
jgi:hypothetical protein